MLQFAYKVGYFYWKKELYMYPGYYLPLHFQATSEPKRVGINARRRLAAAVATGAYFMGPIAMTQQAYEVTQQVPGISSVVKPAGNFVQDIYHTSVGGEVIDWSELLIKLQLLSLVFAIWRERNKTGIRLKEAYKEFHKAGFKGQDVVIGIVDSGAVASMKVPRRRLAVYSAEDFSHKKWFPSDKGFHGQFVTHMLAEALPKAKFVVAIPDRKSVDLKVEAQEKELFGRIKNGEDITLSDFRKIEILNLELIAECIKQTIEKGATHVNVSLGFDDAIDDRLKEEIAAVDQTIKHSFVGRVENEAYKAKLEALLSSCHNESLSNDLKTLYEKAMQPALDSADEHDAIIYAAAGNSGGHTGNSDSIDKGNSLGFINHPNLVLVGSVNHKGEISDWTTEHNANFADNGSGEILVPIVSPPSGKDLPLWRRCIYQYVKLTNKLGFHIRTSQDEGTSFASPAAMISDIMLAQIKPELNSRQRVEVLESIARPCFFSPTQATSVVKEIGERTTDQDLKTAVGTVVQVFESAGATLELSVWREVISEVLSAQVPERLDELMRYFDDEIQGEIKRRVGAGAMPTPETLFKERAKPVLAG